MAEGYTLKDLMKPDRARVQKALSGIINLHKFKESVQDDYNSLVQTSVRLCCGCTVLRLRGSMYGSNFSHGTCIVWLGTSQPGRPFYHHSAPRNVAQLDLMEERRKVDEETESLRLELANMRCVGRQVVVTMAQETKRLAHPRPCRLAIRTYSFLREQEKPEAIALEASVAALVAQKAALDREAAATRAAGLEQKSATAAMADEIVSRSCRSPLLTFARSDG